MAKTKINSDSETQVIDQVVDIIRLMGENRLAEIELETGEMKMSLKKHSAVQFQTVAPAPAPAITPHVVTDVAKPAAVKAEDPVSIAKTDNFHKILSPMTGTFYRAPSPTSEPFVNEGDSVVVGQTVCIVEAMKMMNEIKTDKAGKVVGMCVENGNPVEKGTALISIEG